MHTTRDSRRPVAGRTVTRALALLLGVGIVMAAVTVRPAEVQARGGAGVSRADAEFDRIVEREIKAQDRLLRSAKKQGRTNVGFIRRYKQRALKEDNALAHFLLGRAFGLDEQLDLAVRHMLTSIQKKKDFHQAQFRMAVLYFKKKDMKRAEPYLDAALRSRPENQHYLEMKTKLLFARRDWAGTKRLAEKMLRLDSTNDEARGLLAAAYMGLKDWKNAQAIYAALIRKEPKSIPLRAQWIDCAMRLEQWAQAIVEIKTLLGVAPKDPTLRRMLVGAYMGKGDTAGAGKVLRAMVREDPKNWEARRYLADVLLSSNDPVGAYRELEIVLAQMAALPKDPRLIPVIAEARQMAAFCSLAEAQALVAAKDETAAPRVKALLERAVGHLRTSDALRPLPPHMLDRLQISLARLGRHKERIPYLERMVKSLDGRPKEISQLQSLISILKAGGSEAALEQASDADRLKDLIKRCTAEQVAVRRQALHEYYDLNLPFVDPIIYQRHDVRVEPDAICRFWVVRILGRFQAGTANPDIVRIAARYVGLALEDPASSVRRGAAEALGTIGAPAGILYLLPHLSALAVDVEPKTQDAKDDLEREYNAARGALIELTGRVDYEIGGERWIGLAKAAANRDAWRAWFDTPPGIAKRIEALDDLANVTDVDPRWQLRYILVDVVQDKPAAPNAVALRAYQVLRDRIQALPASRRTQDPWWKTFPMIPDAKVNEAGLPAIRAALRAWWPPKPVAAKGAAPKADAPKGGGK